MSSADANSVEHAGGPFLGHAVSCAVFTKVNTPPPLDSRSNFHPDMVGLRQLQSVRTGRINVLLVSGTLSGGGAERFASTLLQHLDRERFQPSLCLLRDDITYPLASDVPVSIMGHGGPLHTVRTVRRLAQTIDSVCPDIVISTMDYLGMFVGEALGSSQCRPAWLARTSNNPAFLFGSLRGQIRKQWLNRVYPRATLYVANSRGLAESFQKTFPSARGRTRILTNPVDMAGIDQMAREDWPESIDTTIPNIFYSARLRSQKRPDILIEAFRLVLQQVPARLWICGEGPLRSRVESLIEKYRLRPHVRMAGFRSNTFPLLKKCSLAVATSDFEGLPNSILEAQAMGIPVVSTRSSFGPEEIIRHGITGLLTKPGDPREVADGILTLLHDTPLREEMSARARGMMREQFCLESVIPMWESALTEATVSSAVARAA
ncbi:MAG: glycosyltransferase [Planctomycetaceae bacterium]|nr:glycosyltransferase [Planctomycetaceae bacterium]